MVHNSLKTGFTLIEILVVIAVLAVILEITAVGFRDFARYQEYNQAVSTVSATLNQARVEARSAVGDSAHGVKFAGGGITRFAGDTYNAFSPDNITQTFQQVTLIPQLTGGTDEIIFARLTGLPSATGTILIEAVEISATATVQVTETGVIQ